MINLFSGIRDLLVGVAATVGIAVNSISPINIDSKPSNPVQTPQVSSSPAVVNQSKDTFTPVPTDSPAPTTTPLTLNGDNYIYVQGQYSIFFQTIKYLFLVPKKGGSFSGAISGICQAQAGGEYEGGNGGKISGKASGNCNFLGVKYQGSADFRGRLYPETKTIEIEMANSPIKGPVKINYN